MNKSELIEAVASSTGLSKTVAGKAVDAVITVISDTLKEGEQVTLVGFGSFSVRRRTDRTGRDPRTGQPIAIKAAKIPAFRPGKGLKDAVQ